MSKLKQLFPNHKLGDKHDYELQQFTANDMIEFAESVTKEALKNASEKADMVCGNSKKTKTGYQPSCGKWCGGCDNLIIDIESILDENNIPKI